MLKRVDHFFSKKNTEIFEKIAQCLQEQTADISKTSNNFSYSDNRAVIRKLKDLIKS